MRPYNNPRLMAPPEGGNQTALEVRIAELELHSFYAEKERGVLTQDLTRLRDYVGTLEHALYDELDEIKKDREAFIRRIALWIIGTLLTALATVLWNLAWPALRAVFQIPG